MFPNSLAASNTWHKTPFAILVTLSGWVRCLKLALLLRNLLFACNDRRAIIAVNRRLAENSSNGMLFASTLCKIVFAQLKLESRLKERRATVTFTLMYLSTRLLYCTTDENARNAWQNLQSCALTKILEYAIGWGKLHKVTTRLCEKQLQHH